MDTLVGGGSLRTPMTWEAFSALGEAKHHEFFDGLCVVNPPTRRHERAVVRIHRLLEAECPDTHEVFIGWGWGVAGPRLFEPDLMVVARDAPDDDILRLPAPLLVVEVSSPSTRDVDWGPKLAYYGAGGAAWYWIVDLDDPAVTVFEGRDGGFGEVQRITAPEPVVGPFPLVVDPGAIVG